MIAQAIPKTILTKAKKLGIEKITLEFNGGSDEGFLEVSFAPSNSSEDLDSLRDSVYDWAWEAYTYRGAGDGSDYGDTIVYDLKNKTVATSYWQMERVDSDEVVSEWPTKSKS